MKKSTTTGICALHGLMENIDTHPHMSNKRFVNLLTLGFTSITQNEVAWKYWGGWFWELTRKVKLPDSARICCVWRVLNGWYRICLCWLTSVRPGTSNGVPFTTATAANTRSRNKATPSFVEKSPTRHSLPIFLVTTNLWTPAPLRSDLLKPSWSADPIRPSLEREMYHLYFHPKENQWTLC